MTSPVDAAAMPRNRRLLNANFDSLRQRSRRLSHSPQPEAAGRQAAADLVGRLRLDVILSGEVILTDAQLLDGPLFLGVDSPHEIMSRLVTGSDSGLVVRCRGSDLAASLLGFTRDADGRTKAFEFSSIESESVRMQVVDRLATSRENLEDGPASVAELLDVFLGCGLSHADASRLDDAWSAWMSQGLPGLRIEPFDRASFPWGDGVAFANRQRNAEEGLSETPHSYWTQDLAAGGVLLHEQLTDAARSGDETRTSLLRMISAASGTSPADQALLEAWVDEVYHFALGVQADCEDVERIDSAPLKPLRKRGSPISSRELLDQLEQVRLSDVAVPSDFLARLATLENARFQSWFKAAAGDLAAWRNEDKNADARLRTAIDLLESGLRDLPEDLVWSSCGLLPGEGPPQPFLHRIYRYPGAGLGAGLLMEAGKEAATLGVSGAVGLPALVVTLTGLTVAVTAASFARRQLGNGAVMTDIGRSRRDLT